MTTVFNFTFVPWFRSVAPYIHKFRNQTFVVGIAGEAIAAGKLQHLAQDLAMIQSMGVKIVLVHGFRPQVNEQLKAKGHALGANGKAFTPSSIGAALAQRELMEHLRSFGEACGGPKPFSQRDRQQFLNALDALVQKSKRETR